MMNNKVVVFSDYFIPGFQAGGPIKTIKNLIESLNSCFDFKVVTRNHDIGATSCYEGVEPDTWSFFKGFQVYYSSGGFLGVLNYIKAVFTEDADLFYLNSFFSVRFSMLPLLIAKLRRKKVLLAPRGEFAAGALSLRRYRKAIYLFIFKLFRLYKGVVFQASSASEASDIKNIFGSKANIFICPNIASKDFPTYLESISSAELNIVFLGRISPMKNLVFALQILAKVKQPVSFDIYGPIEDSAYWNKCCQIIEQLPPYISVCYKGVLSPKEVSSCLCNYELFFLPTLGENYGHVIVEAMSSGLPVLISDQTPWKDLESTGVGWDIALSESNRFIEVIDSLANESKNILLERRKFVLNWAKAQFSEDLAAIKTTEMLKFALKN